MMVAPLRTRADIKQGVGIGDRRLIIGINQLLADAAVGVAAADLIEMLVIVDAVDPREFKAGGIHQRRQDQGSADCGWIELVYDMRQDQRRFNFEPAGACLHDQGGPIIGAVDDMQRNVDGEAPVRFAGFEEAIGFFAGGRFYVSEFHLGVFSFVAGDPMGSPYSFMSCGRPNRSPVGVNRTRRTCPSCGGLQCGRYCRGCRWRWRRRWAIPGRWG